MNYRHGYHAGGFSDVLKHIVLIALIQALSRKDKPFCYLDTHAGRGGYDLNSEFSQKTQEYANGIAKIMGVASRKGKYENKLEGKQAVGHLPPSITDKEIPALIKVYQEVIEQLGYPHYYPGSPLIAKQFLRENDRMVLMEYHPEEYEYLKQHFKWESQAEIHRQDGYLGIKAFLPPKERRGLILVDPPFEQASEWEHLANAVKQGMQKFPNGVYAIWYPLKNQKAVSGFLKKISTLKLPDSFVAELSIYPSDAQFSLIGCGMVIINAPWQLEQELKPVLSWIWQTLSINNNGSFSIRSLANQ
jgi:23S rRNA (adenine2030-N6)-methyltransferase